MEKLKEKLNKIEMNDKSNILKKKLIKSTKNPNIEEIEFQSKILSDKELLKIYYFDTTIKEYRKIPKYKNKNIIYKEGEEEEENNEDFEESKDIIENENFILKKKLKNYKNIIENNIDDYMENYKKYNDDKIESGDEKEEKKNNEIKKKLKRIPIHFIISQFGDNYFSTEFLTPLANLFGYNLK
jgi:hypothetical protein